MKWVIFLDYKLISLYLVIISNQGYKMADKKGYIAVITGDIVKSGQISPEDRRKMPEKLKHIFTGLDSAGGHRFSIFRGDSFQGAVSDPTQALRTALWIKTALMRTDKDFDSYDCRLALGIGRVTFMAPNVMESDGEAFHNSGRALDAMDSDERLRIATPWEAVNQEAAVHCALLNVIMNRWTAAQAGVIAETLAGKTQRAVAAALQITQPAVSSSLKASGWSAVDALIARYEQLIKTQTP